MFLPPLNNTQLKLKRCRDCYLAKRRVPDGSAVGNKLVFVPENELCAACRLIRQAQSQRQNQRPTAQEFGSVTSIAVEWSQHNLDTTLINGQPGKRTIVTTADGFSIGVGNKFFTETAHKNKRNPDLFLPPSNNTQLKPSQNIYLICTALGLKTVARAMMNKEAVANALGLDENIVLELNHPIGY